MRLALLFAIAACTPPPAAGPTAPDHPDSPPAARPTERPKDARVLSLRGSNTIGGSYAPKLVRAFLEAKGATDIKLHEENRAKQEIWFEANLHGPLWIEINAPGTKYGFESLGKGYTDVVMASRPINEKEAKELSSLGDLTGPAAETIIAMDGIAVIVHPNSQVNHLTIAQLKQIFSGEVTDWSAFGGPSQQIHVFGRDKLSGTHDGFVALVMNGAEALAEKRFEDSAELARTVETTEGAIGYVGLPYIGRTKAIAIQDGDASPLLPTQFTVATEDYALSRRLMFYVPEKAKPLAHELVDFALSDAGQTIASDVGFVPLSLRMDTVHVPNTAPEAYAKLAGQATRLSVDFRFRHASSDVDTKATRDLDRLTHYLTSPTNRGRHLTLVGFADAQGNDTVNKKLAKERADAVAGLLKQRGVEAAVASFGSALPVAPNDTEQGRARNRRVEVWLR
jgi:phosphate transport system substrate-binding protein